MIAAGVVIVAAVTFFTLGRLDADIRRDDN